MFCLQSQGHAVDARRSRERSERLRTDAQTIIRQIEIGDHINLYLHDGFEIYTFFIDLTALVIFV